MYQTAPATKFVRLARVAATCAITSLLGGCIGQSDNFASQRNAGEWHATSAASPGLYTFVTRDGRFVHYAPPLRRASQNTKRFLPASSYGVTYHGGPVQYSPKVYIVFWGGIWKNRKGDPDGVRRYLLAFLKALHGSQWMSTVTQYYGQYGSIMNDTAFGGAYIDATSQLPPHPSDQVIAYEASLAAAHFGDYSGDAGYVVAMPHGHNPAEFGIAYCAYHTYTSTIGGLIALTALPYMPDAGSTCGAGSVNNPGTRDGVTIFEGHEQAETETDPEPFTGWFGQYQFEIADYCEFTNLQDTRFGRRTFPTQPLWSDADGACVQ